jgi:hypothetical protein
MPAVRCGSHRGGSLLQVPAPQPVAPCRCVRVEVRAVQAAASAEVPRRERGLALASEQPTAQALSMVVMPESIHSQARPEAPVRVRDQAQVRDRAWVRAAAQELARVPSEVRVQASVPAAAQARDPALVPAAARARAAAVGEGAVLVPALAVPAQAPKVAALAWAAAGSRRLTCSAGQATRPSGQLPQSARAPAWPSAHPIEWSASR